MKSDLLTVSHLGLSPDLYLIDIRNIYQEAGRYDDSFSSNQEFYDDVFFFAFLVVNNKKQLDFQDDILEVL